MLNVKLSQTKNGKAEKELNELSEKAPYLDAGFFEKAKYSSGQFVADVAFHNEFGTARIPPRPFFRNAIEDGKNRKKWGEVLGIELAKNSDIEHALNVLGMLVVGDIKRSINNSGAFALNSPATIKRKGSSQPLRDTGVLWNAVNFEVRKK